MSKIVFVNDSPELLRRRIAWCAYAAALSLALIVEAPSARAQIQAPPNDRIRLTNAAQVLALGSTNAEQQRLAVKLRGVVTGPSRFAANFSMQDDTEGILVFVNTMQERPPFGSLVEVTGQTDGGRVFTENTAFVRASEVRVLQTGVAPQPRPVLVTEAANFKYYRQWVEVEGVLLQTCYEDSEFVVHLVGDEGWLIGRIRNWPRDSFPTNWWGARVKLEGANIGFDRQAARALGGQSTNHLRRLTPGWADPFEAPLTNATALRAGRSVADRFRLHATVLHAGRDGLVYLRGNDSAFTSEPLHPFRPGTHSDARYLPGPPVPTLHAGDTVEVVGSPRVEGGRLRMRFAQTRIMRSGELPEPVAASFAAVASGLHNDDLVQVRGRLIERGDLPERASETAEWLRLESNGAVIEVILQSTGSRKLAHLKADDLLEATGLVVPSESRIGAGIRLRSASDVRSLGLAPAAARMRAWRLAAILGAAVLALGGWIALLRHKLALQRSEAAKDAAAAATVRQLNISLEKRVAERTCELEDAKEELRRSLDHERELNELKSRFVAMVSHEFRTPLGITMSAVELLRNHLDVLDAAKCKILFEDIFSSTRHMAGLMEQVLVLGRVESGKLALRSAPVDLVALCHRLVDESLSATHRRCPVHVKTEGALEGAQADETLLRQIFSNLLSNAVKYSPAGMPVELTITRESANAVFTVRDRGAGIPEADIPKLFQAFHRAANVGDIPGTGLGLVIAKRCVELHGGNITVKSQLGSGTTLAVTLPLFPSM